MKIIEYLSEKIEDEIDDAAARELAKAQNEAVNAAQSQYLLGVMGKWVANAPAVI